MVNVFFSFFFFFVVNYNPINVIFSQINRRNNLNFVDFFFVTKRFLFQLISFIDTQDTRLVSVVKN